MNSKNKQIPFNMRKKVIASATYEGWSKIPHVSYIYEADATDFYEEYKKLNLSGKHSSPASFNTLLLRLIVEGIKSAPQINALISYSPFLVSGKITVKDEININMPFLLSNGNMITINLHNFESKSLNEMTEYINQINKKLKNTNTEIALLDVGLTDTVNELKHGKIIKVLGRIIGITADRKNIRKYSKKDKKAYYNMPINSKLSKEDLNRGTITVSNLGSAVKGTKGVVALLEIIPPQVCVIGIGALQEKPGIYYENDNTPKIAVRKILPFTIAFDHRALDFGEIAPFINKLESIFTSPSVIHKW